MVRFIYSMMILFIGMFPANLLSQDSPFAGEKGYYIENAEYTVIDFDENDSLRLVTTTYESKKVQSQTPGLFSSDVINYSSSFTRIYDIEAFSRMPKKRGFTRHDVHDILTSDVSVDGVFHGDTKRKSFHYKALTEGAETILSYKTEYLEPRFWGTFYFSSYLPVAKSVYQVKVHKDVKIRWLLKNTEKINLDYTEQKQGDFMIHTWSATNIEKISVDEDPDKVLFFMPHVVSWVESYKKGHETISMLRNESDLFDWYNGFIQMMPEDTLFDDVTAVVDSVIDGDESDYEKVEKVYNWVQENIQYLAFEDGLQGFIPRPAGLVMKRRYGDCKDMSYLLYAMLQEAKVESHLTWIGTRHIPYTHSEVPCPSSDNHMICVYKDEMNKNYYLDATAAHNALGIPSYGIQGKEAMIRLTDKKFELQKVPITVPEMSNTTDSLQFCVIDNEITGEFASHYSGYHRENMVMYLKNIPKANHNELITSMLSDDNTNMHVSGLEVNNLENKRLPVSISGEMLIHDYLIKSGDRLYVNLNISKRVGNQQIKEDSEQSVLDLDFKNEYRSVSIFEIPEGYEVEYIPENVSTSSQNISFSCTYEKIENRIKMVYDVSINALSLSNDEFEDWNNITNQIREVTAETLVLKKI